MSRYFTKQTDPKLSCTCCGIYGMDSGFLLALDTIRDEVGEPLTITSGFRCNDYNDRISSTGRNGPHTTGQAVDIACNNSALRMKIVSVALEQKIGRIGIARSFVHLDSLDEYDNFPENRIWVY